MTLGPPFEVAVYPRDNMQISHRLKLQADDPMLKALSQRWNDAVRIAFQSLPRFDWESAQGPPTG